MAVKSVNHAKPPSCNPGTGSSDMARRAKKNETMTGICSKGIPNDFNGWQLFFWNNRRRSLESCATATESPLACACFKLSVNRPTSGEMFRKAALLRWIFTTTGINASRISTVALTMVPHHGRPVYTLIASKNASNPPTGVKLHRPIALKSPICAAT